MYTALEQNRERSRKLVPFVKDRGSRRLYKIRRLAAWSTAVHVRTAAVLGKLLKRNVRLAMVQVKLNVNVKSMFEFLRVLMMARKSALTGEGEGGIARRSFRRFVHCYPCQSA